MPLCKRERLEVRELVEPKMLQALRIWWVKESTAAIAVFTMREGPVPSQVCLVSMACLALVVVFSMTGKSLEPAPVKIKAPVAVPIRASKKREEPRAVWAFPCSVECISMI